MILRVCDVETNGMEPPAEVCEFGHTDLRQDPDGSWRIVWSGNWLCRVDVMPPEVRAVHHITLDDVKNAEPFRAGGLTSGVDVMVAHSAAFEQKFIDAGDTPWICTYKSALRVWPDAPGHSNSVLKCWLEDQGLLSLDHAKAMPPHRAGPDAYVTAHILLALLKHATVEEMIKWSGEPRLLPRCTIGKFRGKPWADVEWGFLRWMLQQESMEEDLKWNARREMDRRLAEN